jgi:hypothetical protein
MKLTPWEYNHASTEEPFVRLRLQNSIMNSKKAETEWRRAWRFSEAAMMISHLPAIKISEINTDVLHCHKLLQLFALKIFWRRDIYFHATEQEIFNNVTAKPNTPNCISCYWKHFWDYNSDCGKRIINVYAYIPISITQTVCMSVCLSSVGIFLSLVFSSAELTFNLVFKIMTDPD